MNDSLEYNGFVCELNDVPGSVPSAAGQSAKHPDPFECTVEALSTEARDGALRDHADEPEKAAAIARTMELAAKALRQLRAVTPTPGSCARARRRFEAAGAGSLPAVQAMLERPDGADIPLRDSLFVKLVDRYKYCLEKFAANHLHHTRGPRELLVVQSATVHPAGESANVVAELIDMFAENWIAVMVAWGRSTRSECHRVIEETLTYRASKFMNNCDRVWQLIHGPGLEDGTKLAALGMLFHEALQLIYLAANLNGVFYGDVPTLGKDEAPDVRYKLNKLRMKCAFTSDGTSKLDMRESLSKALMAWLEYIGASIDDALWHVQMEAERAALA